VNSQPPKYNITSRVDLLRLSETNGLQAGFTKLRTETTILLHSHNANQSAALGPWDHRRKPAYVCIGLGLWLPYVTWGGVVPDGRSVWGKSEPGQRMRLGQRILFGVGGLLFLGLGVLFLLLH